MDNEYVDKDQAFENEFNFIIENPGNHIAYISFDLTKLDSLKTNHYKNEKNHHPCRVFPHMRQPVCPA